MTLPRTSQPISLQRLRTLFLLLLVAVGCRLGVGLFAAHIYDQQSYEMVVAAVRAGHNVYASVTRYNYAPVWAYVLTAIATLADALHIPFWLLLRLFLALIDCINAILIGHIVTVSAALPRKRLVMLAYLFNPLAIAITGYDAQFEAFAVLPLLIAIFLARRGDFRWLWPLATAALLIKHITLFAVWTLFVAHYRPRRAIAYMSGSLAIFALSFAPFLPDGASGIWTNVLHYTSINTVYGFGLILPISIHAVLFYTAMFALPVLVAPFLDLSALAFLALTYGIGDQYLILPLFWTTPSRLYWLFSIVGSLAILLPPLLSLLVPSLVGEGTSGWLIAIALLNSAWLIVLIWLIARLRRAIRLNKQQISTPRYLLDA